MKHSLNSSHPLIVDGLNTKEVIQLVKDAVDAVGVIEDERFTTKIKQSDGFLNISIKSL